MQLVDCRRFNPGRRYQAGVSLVELLVGLTVGALVLGGAISLYASSVQNSNVTLKSSRLNQELSSLMLVMSNDIRRAGYWGINAGSQYHLNPFSQANATALVVIDDMSGDNIQAPLGQGSCITYAYDATYQPGNVAGQIDVTDLFGFRLNGTVVQMRQSGVVDGTACVGGSCDSCVNGTWGNVTDPNLIEITSLDFDLANSQCLNTSQPNAVDDDADGVIDEDDEYDCYTTLPVPGSGDATLESREVVISVNGRLAADPMVAATAIQTVRVRNDLLKVR